MSYQFTCVIGDDSIELEEMSEDTKVSELAVCIQRKSGIPPSRQQIFHDNGELDLQSNLTLHQLNISNTCHFIVLDSDPSAPLQKLPDWTAPKININKNNENITDFDEWISNNNLIEIKHLLSKHKMDTMDVLSTKSPQFLNLLCDKNIIISKCHNMITKLLTAINRIPSNQSLEEGISPLNGQFKSMTVCSECGVATDETESFNYLSLEIPKYKIVEYSWIDSDINDPPKIYGSTIPRNADVKQLKYAIARNHGVSQIPFTSLKHLNKKYLYPIFGYIRNLCDALSMDMLPDLVSFICVSFYYDSADNELFICDIWKSKIHRELRKHDMVTDINRKSDDIYVYHSRLQDIEEWKDKTKSFEDKTFVITHQHRAIARTRYMHQPGPPRYEDVPIGVPLLITLPLNIKIPKKQIYQRLWKINKPYFKDESLKIDDENKPFQTWAAWGFNNHERLKYNDDTEFQMDNRRNLKFLIHWKDSNMYNMQRITDRPRHKTAPPPLDVDELGLGLGSEQHQIQIHLNEILDTFFKETIESLCTQNECKGDNLKQHKLFKCPDLLIIHLQRFTDDKNERFEQVSNTVVKLPLNGLDLSQYVTMDDEQKMNVIYDCYAISNHNHHFGTNTGYIRNRDNNKWLYLDTKGNLSNVSNVDHMMTSEAYIAYYLNRNSKRKHDLLCFNCQP